MKQILSYDAKANVRKSIFPFSIAALFIFSIVLFSCKKTKDEVPSPEPTFHLNVSTSLVQSPATGGNTTVKIDANAEWKLSIPSGTDWVEVNKTSGAASDSIQINVTKENNSGAKRTVTVTVALVNGKAPAKQITVEQDVIVLSSVSIDWKKVLGGNGNDYGYSIIHSPDGGYLLSGRTTSNNGDITSTKGGIDMWVVKLDAAGSIAWQKTYGGNADEYSVAAANTPDGGYVLTGFTLSSNNGDVGTNHGYTDFWVLKINATGTIEWQKTLGGSGDDRPFAISVTTDGKIGVAGFTMSGNSGDVGPNHGNQDMWIMLLDNNTGTVVSNKSFGGNGDDAAKALLPAPDGGLYVGGSSSSNNNGDVGTTKGSSDFWVLHLDKNLSIVWQNSFGGSSADELNALAIGTNNSLIAAGTTKSNNSGDVGTAKGGEDTWVLQINAATGALGWKQVFGGVNNEGAKGICVTANGTIALAGYTYSNNNGDVEANHGAGEFWVIGLNSNGTLAWKKALGGDNEEIAYSITESADGFAVAGATMSKNSGDVEGGYGNSDVWVVKLKMNN